MNKPASGGWVRIIFLLLLALVFIGIIVGVPYVLYLDEQVTAKFEGKRWELPARVYGRPMDLFPGKRISQASLQKELELLGYINVDKPQRPGEYSSQSGELQIRLRGFDFADERTESRHLKLSFNVSSLLQISDVATAQPLSLQRLDPVLIANIYPSHNEDRILVRRDRVPELLIQSLMAVEDKAFYEHAGVRPQAILRALLVNLQAGRTLQGGSTLTQQLVKNFFLTNERSMMRKINEAIMALLLEWRYDKEEILEAYLNEIYLGQEGSRAIHGFGLASRFYFQRDLQDLQPEQIALLVAIVKGASWYEPRRHPQRALQRRNLVLQALVDEGLLTAQQVAELQARPLGVTTKVPSGSTEFPAFLQLVREQLKRDYRDEDLRSEGLVIFTTLDPQVQLRAEEALVSQLQQIEKDRRMATGTLEAATVIASVEQGEVLAVVGSRQLRFAGFNRALDMRRQIGSLVKPAVFLTALARPGEYNLATLIDDGPLQVSQPNGDVWEPKNYDGEHHGQVMLIDALVSSYNVSTARLALNVGLENVVHTLHALGVAQPIPAYPSLALGALEMSPLELVQMYQIIAANGYRTPLRAILSVINQQGETLQRYPLEVQRVIPPEADYLVTTALHEVTVSGTARWLKSRLPADLNVAGKTGTTNGLRDSWFAGFSGEHVGVTWVGRDDNQPTGLQGSTGALRIWGETFRQLDTQAFIPVEPDALEWHQVSRADGVVLAADCSGGQWLPFIPGSLRQEVHSCAPRAASPRTEESRRPAAPVAQPQAPDQRGGFQWFKELFNANQN